MNEDLSVYNAAFWKLLDAPAHRTLMGVMARAIGAELDLFQRPSRILEVGAGLGTMAAWFAKPDGEHFVTAIESKTAEEFVKELAPDTYSDPNVHWHFTDLDEYPASWPNLGLSGDMTVAEEVRRTPAYDLAISIEVAEHLPKKVGETLVEYLCRHSKSHVFFSGAFPGQQGTGHINEQTEFYWEEQFRQWGFVPDDDATYRIRHLYEDSIGGEWWYRRCRLYRRVLT